jgi:hypothetical protein
MRTRVKPSIPIVGYGVSGDLLHEGKLDLPELREQPTAEESEWASGFIRRRRWQEAVNYRETAPHEYTIRKWQDSDDATAEFDRFVSLVRTCGYADFYYRIRHIYWAVDDYKYWTMGWPVAQTVVINRARLDAPEPWKTAHKSDTESR